MALKRQKYRVWLAGPVTTEGEDSTIETTIEVRHADMLRAEFEAKKQGIPPISDGFPMNHTTVWIWCALVRLEQYAGPYQQFSQVDLLEFDSVKDEDGGSTDVDPTPADKSASPSSLPATTAAAPTTG